MIPIHHEFIVCNHCIISNSQYTHDFSHRLFGFSNKSSGAIYLLQTHVDVNQYSRRWKAYHDSSAAYRNLPVKINIMARAYKSRARKKTVIAKKEKSVLYFCAHINVFHSVYVLEKCHSFILRLYFFS